MPEFTPRSKENVIFDAIEQDGIMLSQYLRNQPRTRRYILQGAVNMSL
ncbi:MAG: hypothetical protein GY808_00630 [Gammaproteobacteria bacterium]|nr:hypothetical protein [Gammaproteobacteria bacterium]